jgi:hypothetical protein
MSIALSQKVKELEALNQELAFALMMIRADLNKAKSPDELAVQIARMNERITALENRPKPGRPPKNG